MELIRSHEWDVKMTIWREKSEWRIGAGRWWRCVKSEVVNQWERSGDKVAPIRTWILKTEVSISNEVKVRVYTMSLSPQEVLIYSHKRTQNNLLCIMSAKFKLIIEILTPLLGRFGMRWKLKRAFLVEGGNMWNMWTKANDHDYVSSLGVWETVEYLVTVWLTGSTRQCMAQNLILTSIISPASSVFIPVRQ